MTTKQEPDRSEGIDDDPYRNLPGYPYRINGWRHPEEIAGHGSKLRLAWSLFSALIAIESITMVAWVAGSGIVIALVVIGAATFCGLLLVIAQAIN